MLVVCNLKGALFPIFKTTTDLKISNVHRGYKLAYFVFTHIHRCVLETGTKFFSPSPVNTLLMDGNLFQKLMYANKMCVKSNVGSC